jgi:lipopolysaccharide transport system permease protein
MSDETASTAALPLPSRDQIARLLNPARIWQALVDFAASAYRTRELTLEMIRRDLGASHAGHGLGALWMYLNPLVVIAVYLLIFGFVIGSKLALTDAFPGDFPSYIAIGLMAWLPVQTALVKSTGALTGYSNLVKQVVFPIEVLPISSVIAAMWPFWPALVLVLSYKMFFGGGLPATAFLLPLVIVLQVALCMGLGFILAGLTCFIRDIREFVGLFCLIAMYITPAVYLPEWVPVVFQPLLYMNPFSYLTWVYQDALFFGEIRHPEAWVVLIVLAVLSLSFGYRLFVKLKPHYGDVI